MIKFDIDKKGYDVEQVNNYISTLSIKYEERLSEQKDRIFTLRNEVIVLKDKLNIYQDKDKQISQALIFAVEKAEQIESGARKLYDLEMKRINILYEKWLNLVSEIEDRFGNTRTDEYMNKLIGEFKDGLNSILMQNNKIVNSTVKQDLKNNSDNYIKNLLNKMDYVINNKNVVAEIQPKTTASTKKSADSKKQINKFFDTANSVKSPQMLNNISKQLNNMGKGLNDGQSIAETYLQNGDLETSGYSKAFNAKKKVVNYKFPEPNDSGFDLQQALNPKEELDEIMKAFDFFDK